MIAALKMTTDDNRQQGPDPREWIVLDEAAELLGCDRSHLARECRRTLEGFGRAMKATPEGGGKAKWFIARRHDLRLAKGSLGEAHQGPDLSSYSKPQLDQAYAKLACVKAFREARSTWRGPQKEWLPRLVKQLKAEHPILKKISPRSLRRWYDTYNNPADFVKLISNAGGNRRGEADPACWDAFKALYLDQNRPSLADCWRRVDAHARETGMRWLTESACRSQLDKHISPEEQAQCRDPKSYRNKFSPYIEYDPYAYEAGERWDGDHCVLDLMCWSGEGEQRKLIRPWITAWIDWRTRRIVGWHLSDAPNSQTILSAFRMGMLDEANHGGPRVVWIDNGKDFASYIFHGTTKNDRQAMRRKRMLEKDAFIKRESGRLAKIEGGVQVDENKAAGVFDLVGVEPHFAIPYNHKGKGRIERWFKTMHSLFDKRFSSYCGPTTDQKPEDLEKVLKSKPHSVPTFEVVKSELEAFIQEYNATVKNRKGAEGLSPDQAMATLPHTERPLKNQQVLDDCLAMWHRPIKVTRNGVRITLGTMSYSYGRDDYELRRLIDTGRKVHVSYDPEDITKVEVYDDRYSHICTAALNRRAGQDEYSPSHKVNQKRKTDRKQREKLRKELRKTDIADVVAQYDPAAGAAMADAALKRSKPREVLLQPKGQGESVAERVQEKHGSTNLADLIRQGNANADAAADARLDEEEPIIGLSDVYERARIAGERDSKERARRKALEEAVVDDEDDASVLSILASQQPPEAEEDDDDIFTLADLDMLGEGGAA